MNKRLTALLCAGISSVVAQTTARQYLTFTHEDAVTNFAKVAASLTRANSGQVQRSTQSETAPLSTYETKISTTETIKYPNGHSETRRSSYIHLRPGQNIHFEGSWSGVKPQINATTNGAVADLGDLKVSFAANCNTIGAVKVEQASGETFRSHVIGLYFEDISDGRSVLIARTQDSIGEIQGNEQVVYSNAFDNVPASIVYRLGPAQIEQDIVFQRGSLPDPKEFGFDPETTLIQVLTEFIEAPNPHIRATILNRNPDQSGYINEDHDIDFGYLSLALGRAFIGKKDGSSGNSIPVTKRWFTQGNRLFLVESVRFQSAQDLLKLSLVNEGFYDEQLAHLDLQIVATGNRELPLPKPQTHNGRMMLASAAVPMKGLILDYILVPTLDDYTFYSGQTYLISGHVTIRSNGFFAVFGGMGR